MLKTVTEKLQALQGGPEILEKINIEIGFKKAKSARNAVGGKRLRSDFDDYAGDGNEDNPKKHKKD